MNKSNLITLVKNLVDKGYTDEFIIKCNLLFAINKKRGLNMDEFYIDASYKIINNSSNEDAQRLFAITSKDATLKGLLIDSLNHIEHIDSTAVQEKFNNIKEENLITEKDEAIKYGMQKITKAMFNLEPNRYIFRKGYPDFPLCPFGNRFEALDWDLKEERYVWLVTTILKDIRLIKKEY